MSGQLGEPSLDVASSPPGFEARRLIGRGASCRVFEAHQQSTRRLVALKLIEADVGDTEVARRFDRECAAMGELGAHPNIVTVYDAGRHGRQPWIAMELCPAGSLADRIAEHGPTSVAEAADVLAKIADALRTAHRRAVVHCDVKPANIMITEFGEPALGDFGIARLRVGQGGTSIPVGYTLNYAPPEALNGEPPGPAGDVYSLGVSVWQLLEGRPPFSRADDSAIGAVLNRILSDPLPPLTRTDVPDDLLALLRGMTAKDPGRRPTDLSAVAEQAAGIAARSRTQAGTGVAFYPTPDAEDGVGPHRADPTSTALTWRIPEVPRPVAAPSAGVAAPLRRPPALSAGAAASGRPPASSVRAAGLLRRPFAKVDGLLGHPAARSVALVVVGLLLLSGIGVGLWRAAGTTEPSVVAAAGPSVVEPPGAPPAPGAVPESAVGAPTAPAGRPLQSGPAGSPAPGGSAAPMPPVPGGFHTLIQDLPEGCTTPRLWSISGPFSLKVTSNGSVSGTASGRGSGSVLTTCDGVTGTINWDHQYTMEFTGRVVAGVVVATGTMVDIDRTKAVSCSKDGQPVECPTIPGAGSPQSYPVSLGGQFSDGSGGGGMEVKTSIPPKGTWSFR